MPSSCISCLFALLRLSASRRDGHEEAWRGWRVEGLCLPNGLLVLRGQRWETPHAYLPVASLVHFSATFRIHEPQCSPNSIRTHQKMPKSVRFVARTTSTVPISSSLLRQITCCDARLVHPTKPVGSSKNATKLLSSFSFPDFVKNKIPPRSITPLSAAPHISLDHTMKKCCVQNLHYEAHFRCNILVLREQSHMRANKSLTASWERIIFAKTYKEHLVFLFVTV